MKLLKIISSIILISIISNCDATDNSSNHPLTGTQEVKANAVQEVTTAPALSIAFLPDKSGSVAQHNIPKFRIEDLNPAINYIRKHGGAVLLAVVASNSDKTTVQVQIDPDSVPARPVRPFEGNYSNRFAFHDAKEKYMEVRLPQFRHDSTRYAKSIEDKIREFKTKAKELMNAKHNPKETDIGSAINRASYFHRLAPSNAKRVTVLISDGLDTQGSEIRTHKNMDIAYYLAYGSTKPLGSWADKCKPIITPDLDFALTEILN